MFRNRQKLGNRGQWGATLGGSSGGEEAEGPEPKSVWEALEASLLLELHQYYVVSEVSGQVGCN